MCETNKTLPYKKIFFDVLTDPLDIKIHIGFKNDLQQYDNTLKSPNYFVI